MPTHLRFLDFPLEIRELVYDHLLCTWDNSHSRSRAYLSTRDADPTAILRTSKQLYHEAYDYLVKRNQFIRLDCSGTSIRFTDLGRHILPVSEDPRKISAFRGFAAHVRWVAAGADGQDDGFRKMYMIRGSQFVDVLRATDFVHAGGRQTISLHVEVPKLATHWEPCSDDEDELPTSSSPSSPSQHQQLRPFQLNLAHQIPHNLHAFPLLSLSGLPTTLTTTILSTTALPRYATPSAALASLSYFPRTAARLATHDAALSAANTAVEAGLASIAAMRAGAAWADLVAQGGRDFVSAVAQVAFELRLARARYALDAMGVARAKGRGRGVMEVLGDAVEEDLRACLEQISASASASTSAFSLNLEDWAPPTHQQALVLALAARRVRLLQDVQGRDAAVAFVERAWRMDPVGGEVSEEREAVAAWSRSVDRFLERQMGVWDMGVGGGVGQEMWQWAQGEGVCEA